MGDLRAARDVAAGLANVGGIPVEFQTEANAQLITLDRLAIVEWLRDQAARLLDEASETRVGDDPTDIVEAASLDCFAVGISTAADRLESAIKRAGGGEL